MLVARQILSLVSSWLVVAMSGQYNLKASVVVWSPKWTDFDVVIRRTKSENSDAYAPTPGVSFLSCLSLDDRRVISSTADILRSLPSRLANAEEVQRASQNPALTANSGTFIIDEVIRLLEFYGQVFGLRNADRGELIRQRNVGPPLQVFEASTGSIMSSVVRSALTMEEFEALNLRPSSNPNDPAQPDFKGRLDNLILGLRNCSNYLRSNNWDDYKAECRDALFVADFILTDAEIVTKVVVPTLMLPPELDRNSEFSNRFRGFIEGLNEPKSSKGLVGTYMNSSTVLI